MDGYSYDNVHYAQKKKLEEHAFGAVSDIGDLTTFYYMQNRESMMPPLDGESTNE